MTTSVGLGSSMVYTDVLVVGAAKMVGVSGKGRF